MADNYQVKDGTGTLLTIAAKLTGGVLYPRHIGGGIFAGAPTDFVMTNAGALDVTLIASLPAGANTIGTVNLGSLSGAATAAKQPAFGTAGVAATDVLTIQGIASGTAIPISVASLPLPAGSATAANQATAQTSLSAIAASVALGATAAAQTTANGSLATIATNSGTQATDASLTETHGTKAAGTAATKSLLIGGVFNTSLPTLTNGQQACAQFDSSGRLLTSATSIAAAFADGWDATQGTKADAAWASGSGSVVALLKAIAGAALDTTPNVMNLTQVAGASIAQGHGVAASAIRVELPTDGTGVVGLNAGSAKIGITTTDQTTHGTTDLVAADITKVAGAAVATGHGTASGAIRVELPTDGTGTVGLNSGAFDVPTTITRPANTTAYTANDALGGALDLGVLGPTGAAVQINSLQIEADITAIPAGQTTWVLYLYNVTPPSATADNGAWDLPSGDRASFLGSIAIPTMVDLGSTLYVEVNNIGKQVKLSGTHLFAYLVTVGGFTPAANSEVYKLTVHTVAL